MRDYRVLIVEDDAIDRQFYCKLLTQPGADICHIRHAEDGPEGLALLRTDPFDCMLLDFSLPGMNGFEFLTNATINGELPCAVVLIIAQGDEATALEAMKRGVQDYLVKDEVTASSLWRAVTQAVAQVDLRRRLAGSTHNITVANLALEKEVKIRKAAEAELHASRDLVEQANAAKTRFIAMMTHELRTPLDGILGYAQLLRIEGGLSARQDTHVGAMIQAGRHLLGMIEGVLDFACIEAGRMELHPEQISVRELTEACTVFISPMATERALSLRVVNAYDAPRQVFADPARLRQVVLNLLGNAVKYTNAGSVELRILAGSTPGALRIEVADTGRGIDAMSRDRLLKDFERLEAGDSVRGAGLSLAISAQIIRLMGGTINHMANPNDPNGGGSVFWFELPAVDNTALPRLGPVKTASPSSGRRVLLVDDIKINLDIIGSFLDVAGHAVTFAESGDEAVRLAAEQQFDLILMDVRMSDMDGLEAARRIRKLPGSQGQVPILALTAYASPSQTVHCLSAGMNGHVPKPVDYDTLIRAIDDAMLDVPSYCIGDLHLPA